jgi:hypothetical protein
VWVEYHKRAVCLFICLFISLCMSFYLSLCLSFNVFLCLSVSFYPPPGAKSGLSSYKLTYFFFSNLHTLVPTRSTDASQPGPDGRPAIEYVRDIYAELMAMGEGFRRPGDREDISSDDEDELEAARRNWPRDPLTGSALAIARMWLAKVQYV